MKDNKGKNSYSFRDKMNIAFVAILIIAIIALFIFHIVAEDPTDTETALFAFLQFIFSTFLAWILANYSSKKEFEASQKKFAISAYRRINEIERGVDSLIAVTTTHSKINNTGDLKFIEAIGNNIQNTIQSSIADWADVIGEEIATENEIEKLKREQENLLKTFTDKNEESEEKVKEELAAHDLKMKKLIDSLPSSLAIQNNSEEAVSEYNLHRKKLRNKIYHTGILTVMFRGDLSKIKKYNEVTMRLLSHSGEGIFLLYNESDEVLATMFNASPLSESSYTILIYSLINTKELTVDVKDQVREFDVPNREKLIAVDLDVVLS
ncbi:hypothetical protein LX97_00805 [Nonlabens dokdonensis]|uniref:Uncharacterized protein n=2 Tax=Nonlabens dokdonensis TaxID=328515 RepID=L7W7K4_NONDD|nr:hypothetical protein [Nonlabens dokdonensis]AGC76129.1 hypothetical protein DDD_1002 [Nonlabens dokdonensis DSW-6]PZX43800.1 hypothetical protein LX97_00805 [Nonlabens dokdonensis]